MIKEIRKERWEKSHIEINIDAIQKPDYKNSILSVTNSILRHYGITPHHDTLPLLDELLTKTYKNVVLLVFDGLGTNVLTHNLSQNSFMMKNTVAEISSVYPSTTTAALGTLQTGKTPNEHGWIGWSCYFREVDKCIDLFSGHESGIAEGAPAAPEHMPNKLLAYENIFSLINKATGGVVKTCAVSPFTNYFANTCEAVCEHIRKLCAEDGRKFIYAYHFQPDKDIHDLGVSTESVREMIVGFDSQINALAAELKNTLLIITADHGMTDITMKCVEDFPKVHDCLKRHICVEPRCCSFYVKDECKTDFPKIFDNAFQDQFILFSHDEFLESGLLGTGIPHVKVSDFVGDYVAAAVSDIGLWYKNDKGEYHDYKGAHAGLTRDELKVPLIIIEKT